MTLRFFCSLYLSLFLATATIYATNDNERLPWVENKSLPYQPTNGLQGRHLCVWASHGNYFDQNEDKWRWQRPALYGTTEDLFTQTIVIPYLIPMLENAGAVVFTPRERDWQRNEVIVDNDLITSTSLINYQEHAFKQAWKNTDQPGFAFHDDTYRDGENPFVAGTARMTSATKSKSRHSTISYQPTIAEEGRYAVYVSYQTLENSIPDAHYTVWHKGIKTEFHVNQRMGGGTWVYLGTFDFDAGCSQYNRVELSNQSQYEGTVTADAVRFGGGMGNIERFGQLSGMPRCLEGARYYGQWAGMPYEVYSTREGENDYADDINVRSLMLNELCGGSEYAPNRKGRHVPFDLSLAVHSDAGYNKPDGQGVYGSLAVCTTHQGDSTLGNGRTRDWSRDLASRLLYGVTSDLQRQFEPWPARDLYDRNYSETRLPVVPSAILETLSHQSFQDMRYGHDPNFKFALARSIYKQILGFVSNIHGTNYTVAPLAPTNFRIELSEKNNEALLSWSPVVDPLDDTAVPTSYVIYTAEGTSGFNNGTPIATTSALVKIHPGILYSFYITAVNKGGQSFPTQLLSVCYQPKAKQTILVVDGFQRLSSPTVCENGFDLNDDIGVSYGSTCGWLGPQKVFDATQIGIEGSTGLGYSSNELAGHFIGGNDFNYVRTHAEAICASGKYNVVSCSKDAIDLMPLYKYNLIDLILGLERNDGHSLVHYEAFPRKLQSALSQFTAQGGRLIASGAYIGADMQGNADDIRYLGNVLKCQWIGENRITNNGIDGLGLHFTFYRNLNEQHYAAPRTDVIMPAEQGAFPAMTYADGHCAAVAYKGADYRCFAMGFPFECIQRKQDRKQIMQGLLNFLLGK